MAYSTSSAKFRFDSCLIRSEGQPLLWLSSTNYGTTLALEIEEARDLAKQILCTIMAYERDCGGTGETSQAPTKPRKSLRNRNYLTEDQRNARALTEAE